MSRIRIGQWGANLAALLVCAMPVGLLYAAPAQNAGEQERKLIAILQSDAPPQEKAIPCKQLVLCGTKAAVPALAALLADEKLASWSRVALEAIPDPAVEDALRAAVPKLQGRLLVGVLNSIGVRRDAQAVALLVPKLQDPDAEVAAAAAVALGHIGGTPAANALAEFLPGSPAAVRSAVAEGCILCAARFYTQGDNAAAIKLYDLVRKTDVPKQRLLEGIRGAILARQAAGLPLLLEQLQSPDKSLFGIGLRTARELPGGAVTDALVAQMAHLTPERQSLMVLVLADRGDPAALPALLEVLQSGPPPAVLAALGAMERIGNASCVPALLKVALDNDEELSQVAKAALYKLPGTDVDAQIAARIPQAAGKARQIFIELVGQRRIAAALPALVPLAEDADAGIRSAAVAAIATLGGEKQVGDLVRILQKTSQAVDRAALEKALTATSTRAGAACAPQVLPLAGNADPALRIVALHALAGIGGPAALAAVNTALHDNDAAVQDEAARALSTWPNKWPQDASVMPVLLDLAKSAKKPLHQVLALRGYMQYLQGDKTLPDDDRLARVTELLPQLTGHQEQRLACSVLGTIGNAKALELLLTYAAEPATAEEACSAIVTLAERKDLKNVSPEQRAAALQTVLDKTKSGPTRKKAHELLKGAARN